MYERLELLRMKFHQRGWLKKPMTTDEIIEFESTYRELGERLRNQTQRAAFISTKRQLLGKLHRQGEITTGEYVLGDLLINVLTQLTKGVSDD